MEKYPRPEDLVGQLAPKNGTLLSLRGGNVVPANYLHVAFGRDDRERSYLDRVVSGMANQTQAKGNLSGLINSADRFRCRLIYTLDLVPLEQMDSYRSSLDVYRAYVEQAEDGRGRMGREVQHLFPAEVNAAKFESRLNELHLPPREFHNDLVLQLEDIDRFRLFVRAWAFGVIRRDRDDVEGGYQNYYCIALPAEDQRGEGVFDALGSEKIYLTRLSPGEPDILDALKVFNYVGKDQRSGYYQRIDYARVQRALDTARHNTVNSILQGSNLALSVPIRDRLERLSEAERERGRLLYAERAHLQNQQAELEKQVQDSRLTDPRRDTAIVFYLALADDIRNVQIAIEDILQANRGV